MDIGDIVILQWNGYHRVPKFASGQRAKIVGKTNRGIFVVEGGGFTGQLRVRPIDILKVLPK